MEQRRDGKIIIPVDFNNKNKLLKITFFVMDDGGFNVRAGKKTYAVSDSGQVADILTGIGDTAMVSMEQLMKGAQVGTAFTFIAQIREAKNQVIPGLGFIEQEVNPGFYSQGTYWERLLKNWFMVLNIEDSVARRYRPDKEGFLTFQQDLTSNKLNVDKAVIGSVLNMSGYQQDQFIGEFDIEEEGPAKPNATVKVEHGNEGNTRLS